MLHIGKFRSATGLYVTGDLAVAVYDQYGKIYAISGQKDGMMAKNVIYSDLKKTLSYKKPGKSQVEFDDEFIVVSNLEFEFNITDVKENAVKFNGLNVQ